VRRYAVSLLDAILGGSASSRLFQEIREKRGMAYSVYTYGSQYAETGQVGVYVGTREDNLDECLSVTAAELRDIAAGNLRPGELDRAKENLEGRLLSLESVNRTRPRPRQARSRLGQEIRRVRAVTEDDATAARGSARSGSPPQARARGAGSAPRRASSRRSSGSEGLPFRDVRRRVGARPALGRAGLSRRRRRWPGPGATQRSTTRPDAVLGNAARCPRARFWSSGRPATRSSRSPCTRAASRRHRGELRAPVR
jgi:hypothetical protein